MSDLNLEKESIDECKFLPLCFLQNITMSANSRTDGRFLINYSSRFALYLFITLSLAATTAAATV